jgi:integrase
MGKNKLTALAIDNTPPPETGRREVFDSEVPGLLLRVTATGSKSWSLVYRVKGQARRLTLGSYPGVSLKDARERARDARAVLQRGGDPVQDRKDEAREASVNGFETCVGDFIEKYAKPKNRRWKETKRVLDKLAVPVWGNRAVKDIRRRDVVELVEKAKGGNQANKLRLHLSKMFNWLLEREAVEVNPVTGVAPRMKYVPRDRVLTDAEVVALWNATAAPEDVFGQACRFLLLTGMRPGEAAGLLWSEVEGDWATMPASRMKANRDFRAPLSPAAKAIIDARPKLCGYVFTTDGETHLWMNSKPRLVIHSAMEKALGTTVPRWTPHDLRRTLSTGLAMLGFSNEVIDRVTAHQPKSSNVTAFVYNRHRYDEEAMKAVCAWSQHVAKLVGEDRIPA